MSAFALSVAPARPSEQSATLRRPASSPQQPPVARRSFLGGAVHAAQQRRWIASEERRAVFEVACSSSEGALHGVHDGPAEQWSSRTSYEGPRFEAFQAPEASLGAAAGILPFLSTSRVVPVAGPIELTTAGKVAEDLLALDLEDQNKPIFLYIQSPGGSTQAALAIVDLMNYMKSPVYTIATGMVGNVAALLLANGKKGFRFAFPNTRVLIHQPIGNVNGAVAEIQIQAKEVAIAKERYVQLLAELTGQTIEKVEQDTERDNFMSAEEARAYGIIDVVGLPEGFF
eukprot:tig00000411_g533.t1